MTNEKNSKIVKFQGPKALSFNNFDEILKFASIVTKTELVPKTYRNKEADAAVAVMYGMEIGLPPLASLQNIAVVNGMPTVWGDAQLSIVQSSGSYEWHKTSYTGKIEDGSLTAKFEVKRKDMGEPVVKEFSVIDAKAANLWGKGGTWKTHPKQMLGYKARAFALREAFADILKGIHSAEEMEGVNEVKDVTPQTPLTPVHSAPDLDAAMKQIEEPKKEPVVVNENQIDMFHNEPKPLSVLDQYKNKINNATKKDLVIIGSNLKSELEEIGMGEDDKKILRELYNNKMQILKNE